MPQTENTIEVILQGNNARQNWSFKINLDQFGFPAQSDLVNRAQW